MCVIAIAGVVGFLIRENTTDVFARTQSGAFVPIPSAHTLFRRNANHHNGYLASRLMDMANRLESGATTVTVGEYSHRRATAEMIRNLNGGVVPSVFLFESTPMATLTRGTTNTSVITNLTTAQIQNNFTLQQWRLVYITFPETGEPIFTWWMSGAYRDYVFNHSSSLPSNQYNAQTSLRNRINNDFDALLNSTFPSAGGNIVTPAQLPGQWQTQGQTTFLTTNNNNMQASVSSDRIWLPSSFEIGRDPGNLWNTSSAESVFTTNNFDVWFAWLRGSGQGSQTHLRGVANDDGRVTGWVPSDEIRAVRPALHLTLGNIATGVDPGPSTPTRPPANSGVFDIVDAMGTGWNLGNTLDATTGSVASGPGRETNWHRDITTPELLQYVKSLGFGTVRIPVSWGPDLGMEYPFTVNEAWMDRVQEVVDYAYNIGMFVVLNTHHEGSRFNNWANYAWLINAVMAHSLNGPQDERWTWGMARFSALWSQIATRFRDYGERLVFEAQNEIGLGHPAHLDRVIHNPALMELNQIFVDAVRGEGSHYNRRRWLAVSGTFASMDTIASYEFQNTWDFPNDPLRSVPQNRFMYKWHWYPSFAWQTTPYTEMTPGQVSTMVDGFLRAAQTFVGRGIPVLLGEYGAQEKQNTAERAYFAERVNLLARTVGVVPIWWDNNSHIQRPENESFGLIIRTPGDIHARRPEIIEGIMRGWNGYLLDRTTPVTEGFLREQLVRVAEGDLIVPRPPFNWLLFGIITGSVILVTVPIIILVKKRTSKRK